MDRPRGPATRTQQDAGLQPRDVKIIDAKVSQIERRLNHLQRRWLNQPLHLRHVEHRLRTIDLLEIANDLENRRLCSIEMQTGHRMEGVAPRWRQKGDNQVVAGMPARGQVVFVAAKHQIDRRVQLRDIAGGQVEHSLLDLKADTFGGREMPQHRIEPIA